MDTIQTEARLSQDKLTCISKQLSTWRGRYFLCLDPYSTPVRLYNHARHTFTAQMYNTVATVKELQHTSQQGFLLGPALIGGTPQLLTTVSPSNHLCLPHSDRCIKLMRMWSLFSQPNGSSFLGQQNGQQKTSWQRSWSQLL